MDINNGMTRIEVMAVDDIIKLIDKYEQTRPIHNSASCVSIPDYSKLNKALESAIISQLKLMTLGEE